MQVSALYFEKLSVAKRFKRSKQKFCWHFAVDSTVHCVELIVSFLSKKRRLVVDGCTVMRQGRTSLPVHFTFRVGRVTCTALTVLGQFDLEIEGILFSQLPKEPQLPAREPLADLSVTELEEEAYNCKA
jgi:hypothetical protein